ncbi:MAG: YihA family ribosome biogenesis GTP-binding protein [Bacilli bacterium]|nr:YihA family ribosome biogenesis GTP-binding protein [Bacilli bacterium]
MIIKEANLDIIATRRSQYPMDNKPEFLLVGRSNVGKSSFINSILGRKNLAYTSSKPGKTQTLNFYGINDEFYLIDVPGYGYAQTSKENRQKFGMMIEEYLETREQLKRVFMLVDFKIKPTEDDLLMYNFLKYYNVPVTIIATKADKVTGSKKQKNLKTIIDTLDLVVGDDLVVFSSVTKLGVKEVLKRIEDILTEG